MEAMLGSLDFHDKDEDQDEEQRIPDLCDKDDKEEEVEWKAVLGPLGFHDKDKDEDCADTQ